MRFSSRHRSQSSSALSDDPPGPSQARTPALGQATPSPFSRITSTLFSGAGEGRGKGRPGLPRSASSAEGSSWRTGEVEGGQAGWADGRKASDASWSGSSAVRFDVQGERQTPAGPSDPHRRERSSATYSSYSRSTAPSNVFTDSPYRHGHSHHPSSTTSLHPASLARTYSNNSASSSAASSDFPRTPAQNEGNVVYRSRSSIAMPTSSRKGKEKEQPPPTLGDIPLWRAGTPVLAPPVGALSPPSTARRPLGPVMIDPRFTFPMKRGGVHGSGSGGSGSGSGSPAMRPAALQLGAAPRRASVQIREAEEAQTDERRGSWTREGAGSASKVGGMSYIASLGSRPLVDEAGRSLPSYQSYSPSPFPAATPATLSPQTNASPPSLAAFSPVQPFSPTSPLTSTFTTPETPAVTKLGPAFSPSSPLKPKRRRTTFSARRRTSRKPPSPLHGSPPRQGSRRHSLASSTSSTARASTAVPTRTTSLPDLRAAASGDADEPPLPHFRRPSIPFDTFSPRPARTRSPGEERRSRDSLRRGATPIVFPSGKGSAIVRPTGPKPPRPPRSAERAHGRKSSRNLVASGACEALVFAHPRVVVVPGSPASSVGSSEGEAAEETERAVPRGGRRSEHEREEETFRARNLREAVLPLREGPLSDSEVDALLDAAEADRSSVRRVLLENEASRAERAAWSDSATKALGYGLSVRLAELDRGRRDEGRSAAAEKRRMEKRRVRQEVARRKAREAAESEGDEIVGGRRRRKRSASTSRLQVPGSTSAPEASPPMPTSFEPFSQFGRKLSLSRTRSRSKSRSQRPSEGGAAGTTAQASSGGDGIGLGIVGALKRKVSISDSRRPSASTGPGQHEGPTTPRAVTVRGQPIRHLRTSNSVDSLYDRANVAAGPAGLTALYDSPPMPPSSGVFEAALVEQYGEALVGPDEPSPTKGEMRRPSVVTQNAFLSLPPHLHHLLRSPERNKYAPSRPAPPIPSRVGQPIFAAATPRPLLPVLAEATKRSSADSTFSAAKLSLALEDKLQRDSASQVKAVDSLQVATEAPLVYTRQEEAAAVEAGLSEDQAEEPAPSRLTSSRSAPLLSVFTTREETAEPEEAPRARHPFALPQLSPSASFPSSRSKASTGGRRSSPKSARRSHSRTSSGSSAVHMEVEGDFGGLFFSPPQPMPFQRRPSNATDSGDSIAAPCSDASRNLRIGDVPVSPVSTQHRPFSMLSHFGMTGDDQEELVVDEDGPQPRQIVPQRSFEAIFAAPSTSFDSQPSFYTTVEEPSSLSTTRSGPFLVARPLPPTHQHSTSSRPSTAQSTQYATADEGASTDFKGSDLPDIVFPGDSPASVTLSLPISTAAPIRPRLTPAQGEWASTSFAREYLGSFAAADPSSPLSPTADKRASGESSGQSFLVVGDEEMDDERPIPSPSSFIDFSPPSSAPGSPNAPSPYVFPSSSPPAAQDSPAIPRSPASDTSVDPADLPLNRTSYLSVNSTHFIDPAARGSMSYSLGSESRYSGLTARLSDFPAPPAPSSVDQDSASDGDDERDEEEDDDQANATMRFPSNDNGVNDADDGIRRPRASMVVPTLSSLPTVQDRPLSNASWLDFEDSTGSGGETLGRRTVKSSLTRNNSGSSWRTFLPNSRSTKPHAIDYAELDLPRQSERR
ncbi:hypothetical protein JCM10207_003458 [Rhodosporidiobolus poonsookiae]